MSDELYMWWVHRPLTCLVCHYVTQATAQQLFLGLSICDVVGLISCLMTLAVSDVRPGKTAPAWFVDAEDVERAESACFSMPRR
jgi:hypothetical protein